MVSTLPILILGIFLGARHATDADHVVAVATIVSRERSLRTAGWVGALWGIGHSLTIRVVGGALVMSSVVIPPRLGLGMELTVAVMLMILGAMNMTGTMQRLRHAVDRAPVDVGPFARLAARGGVRPLIIGVVHGLAGSAAIALLVLTTIREPSLAIVYLFVFGVGTVAGMATLTLLLALPFAYCAERFARVNRYLGHAAGALSVAFGLVLAYRICVVDGFFSAAPHWLPQ
jgi:high-affinity nickel-transport protein